MFDRGHLTLFRWQGIPIRAHWSVPVGLVLLTGLRFAPGAWLGVLSLILLHELGHAFLVRRAGLVVLSVELTGFGGVCRWTGAATARQRAAIAWGGVLAQLLVLSVAAPIWWLWGRSGAPFVVELLDALTRINLILIGLNLLPFRPLDGAEACGWFRLVGRERPRRRGRPPDPERPQTLREALQEADRRSDRR